MAEDTTTQFKADGDPAFPAENEGNDNPAASSAGEKTDTTQTQSQEGGENSGAKKDDGAIDWSKFPNIADHPRWKERDADWDKRFNEQETRHVEEMSKIREDLEKRFGQSKPASDTPDEVPAWFGGDEGQWKQFRAWNEGLISKAKEEARAEAVKEFATKTEAEQKAINDATTYMNEQVTAIEADKELNPKGEKIDRNKLWKIVLDNDLVDSKGRWNYRAGYQMMKSAATKANDTNTKDRKDLAGATTSENRAETTPPPFSTSADFSKPGARPW